MRAEFDKREKPLSTLKELVGDADPEIKAFATKFERIKKLAEFYLSKVFVVNNCQCHKLNVSISIHFARKICQQNAPNNTLLALLWA